MARLHELPREAWSSTFDAFTKRFLTDHRPENAEIEIVSPDLGDQFRSRERILGITYDRKKDSIEFALAEGDHRIIEPREVWVEQEDDGFIRLVEVLRPDGTRELIRIESVGIVSAEAGPTRKSDG